MLIYLNLAMENECDQLLKLNYASIQDKTQLENVILQHKQMIAALIKQIHALTGIKQKQSLERNVIVNRMQENMLENTQQIINFKNKLNQVTEEHQKLTREFDDEKERFRKSHDAQQTAEMNDLNKRMQELQAEYRGLQEMEQREQGYIREIAGLKERLIARQYQHHDNMNEQEKRQVRENLQLATQNSSKIQEVRRNIYHVAREIVIEEKYSDEQRNQQLKTRLLQLQGELAAIKKDRNEVLEKRKEFKINVSLNEEELEEYKAVGSLQKAKIKANKDKIDSLRGVIEEEVGRREAGIEEVRKKKGGEIKGLRVRLLQLQREREEMRINIERMKILGETILMQREEVEQFFIMALETCKREIESQTQQAFNVGKQAEKSSYGDKVDIEELSPKDKQRILTNLYTKLALGP